MSDDGKKSWFADFFDTYGVMRLWIIGLLGPVLVISEMLQGRAWLGLGLAFICVMTWTQLAKQLGAESTALERISNVSMIIGGALLVLHYALWWIGYLR